MGPCYNISPIFVNEISEAEAKTNHAKHAAAGAWPVGEKNFHAVRRDTVVAECARKTAGFHKPWTFSTASGDGHFFPEMDDDVFGAKWPPPWAIRAKAIAGGVPQGRRIP